jgi:imidazolonepropionase
MKIAFVARRIVTCDPTRATAEDPLGVIEDGSVVVEHGKVVWVGTQSESSFETMHVRDAGELLTPALVDAHTHAAWVGSRHGEYEVRMRGGDYVQIAAAGGGIASTQRAVAKATEDELVQALEARLARMASLGVGTVEVKSGYGLFSKEELKLLRAIARASSRADLPRVVATYLALHALPKDWSKGRDAYVDEACALCAEVAREKLATFVDAYVDPHAFTVDEARKLGRAALSHGLGIRLHIGQFGDVGGAELAAELGAASADHLEHVSEQGAEALARGAVSAVMLPVAAFTLGQSPPPIAKLRAAGVKLVVASDSNPGTAPTESLPLAMALAVRSYGLSIAETFLASTRNAAASLRGEATGMIAIGSPADLAAWDLPHETCIMQPWGTSRVRAVWRDGVEITRTTR